MEHDSAHENSSPSYEPYFQDPDEPSSAEFPAIERAGHPSASLPRLSPSESISYGHLTSSAPESGSELEVAQPHAKLQRLGTPPAVAPSGPAGHPEPSTPPDHPPDSPAPLALPRPQAAIATSSRGVAQFPHPGPASSRAVKRPSDSSGSASDQSRGISTLSDGSFRRITTAYEDRLTRLETFSADQLAQLESSSIARIEQVETNTADQFEKLADFTARNFAAIAQQLVQLNDAIGRLSRPANSSSASSATNSSQSEATASNSGSAAQAPGASPPSSHSSQLAESPKPSRGRPKKNQHSSLTGSARKSERYRERTDEKKAAQAAAQAVQQAGELNEAIAFAAQGGIFETTDTATDAARTRAPAQSDDSEATEASDHYQTPRAPPPKAFQAVTNSPQRPPAANAEQPPVQHNRRSAPANYQYYPSAEQENSSTASLPLENTPSDQVRAPQPEPSEPRLPDALLRVNIRSRSQLEHRLRIPFSAAVHTFFASDPDFAIQPIPGTTDEVQLVRRPIGQAIPPTDFDRALAIVRASSSNATNPTAALFRQNQELAAKVGRLSRSYQDVIHIDGIPGYDNLRNREPLAVIRQLIDSLHPPLRITIPVEAFTEALVNRLAPLFVPDELAGCVYAFIEAVARQLHKFYTDQGPGLRDLHVEVSNAIARRAITALFDPAQAGAFSNLFPPSDIPYLLARARSKLLLPADPRLAFRYLRRPDLYGAKATSPYYLHIGADEYYPYLDDKDAEAEARLYQYTTPETPLLTGHTPADVSRAIADHLLARIHVFQSPGHISIDRSDFRHLLKARASDLTPGEPVLKEATRAFENELADSLHAEFVSRQHSLRITKRHLQRAFDQIFAIGTPLAHRLTVPDHARIQAAIVAFQPQIDGIRAKTFHCPTCERRAAAHNPSQPGCSQCGPDVPAVTRALCRACYTEGITEIDHPFSISPDAFASGLQYVVRTPLERITPDHEVTLTRAIPAIVDGLFEHNRPAFRESLRGVLTSVISAVAEQSRAPLNPSPFPHPVRFWQSSITLYVKVPDPDNVPGAEIPDDEGGPPSE